MAAKAIAPAATSVTAFVGPAPGGVPLEPMAAASFDDFVRAFGEAPSPLAAAVEAFFTNGGQDARIVALAPSAAGAVEYRAAFDALRATGGFNLLCVLPASGTADVPIELLADALRLSVDQRAMLIVDAPREWSLDSSAAVTRAAAGVETMLGAFAATDPRNAALYLPSLQRGSTGASSPTQIPACGAVAGVFARVDRARGVWKAAAGTEATVLGGVVPAVNLRERDNCLLNALGVNCFRAFSSFGTVVWGARTLHGADRFADQFKYVPIRRLSLFLENSLTAGLGWTADAPNVESTWTGVRAATLGFLRQLWTQGGLQGAKLEEAAFVKCDRTTMTQDDIDNGRLNVQVGFAALKPSEFVVLDIRLLARSS